jgi:hypothetical protein
MAEYCSQCRPFKESFDINLFQIALKLKRGYSTSFNCEGCNNKAVYKDEQGLIYLVRFEDNDYKYYPVNIEDLIA